MGSLRNYRTVLVENGVVITSEVYPHFGILYLPGISLVGQSSWYLISHLGPTICVRCGSEARVDGGGQTREPLAMAEFMAGRSCGSGSGSNILAGDLVHHHVKAANPKKYYFGALKR